MFAVGVAFVSLGYVLVYHGIDVLQWAQSDVASKTRPVPMSILFGAPLPTAPPTDVFHPVFTLSATDRANAAIALGAQNPNVPAGTALAPPSNVPGGGGGGLVVPVLPGEGGGKVPSI